MSKQIYTDVISARVPKSVKVDITKILETNRISMSEFLQKAVINEIHTGAVNSARPVVNKIVKGKVNVDDEEFANLLLTLAGGSAVGVSVYLLVKWFLEEHYPEVNAKDTAAICGLSLGVVSAIGIATHVNKK